MKRLYLFIIPALLYFVSSAQFTQQPGSMKSAKAPISLDTISVYPYNESFESGLGSWEQSTEDDFDWTRNSGGTPTTGTGPSAAQDGTWYIYIEGTGNYPDLDADIYATFDFSSITFPRIDFYYHMYSTTTMGNMYLMISDDSGSSWTTLWSMSGNQGDTWHNTAIDLFSYSGDTVIIQFRGHTLNSFRSDMAVDNISVVNAADPVFSSSPDSAGYGECPLNHISDEYFTRNFTLQNIGASTLEITSISLSGPDASDFQLTDLNTYPATLSGSATLSVDVMIDPLTVGSKEAYLQVVTTETGTHDIPLTGQAYVAAPRNLSGTTTITYSNELDWDIPLPENELRYDNGIAADWLSLNTTSSDNHYAYTRLTAPFAGSIDYVSLYTRNDDNLTGWNQLIVCPDNGSGQPNLGSPYETFSGVGVSSSTGEWILLELTTPQAITQGSDFFVVVRWPVASTDGPYVGSDNTNDFSRSATSVNGGSGWSPAGESLMMRAYLTSSKNGSTALLDYTVHRGTSSMVYTTDFTGISPTAYTDSDVTMIPGNTYFYGVSANYSGSMVSDTSNEISITLLDLPTGPDNPSPPDLAPDQAQDVNLSWTNHGNVQLIDLYLSMNYDSVSLKTGGTALKLSNAAVTTTYDPGLMMEGTWYWRVIVKDGVSTSVDGDIWEFTVNDIVDPSISYTPLGNILIPAAQTLSATITDLAGIPVSGPGLPVLYWKIGLAGSWQPATATSMGSSQYDFTFGSGTVSGDKVFYYVVAQDNSSNLNVIAEPSAGAGTYTSNPPAAGTPPDVPYEYQVLTSYSGAYTIGSSGADFTTITGDGGLFQSLNEGYLSGDISVSILEDLTEPGTHALNECISQGGDWSVTIQPDLTSRATISVTGTVDDGLIRLNGADRITFDGLAHELAFINNGTYFARVFMLFNGASLNTITECEILTGSNVYDDITTGIHINGLGNNSNTISGNIIYKAAEGIKIYGTSGTYNSGNIITGNLIGAEPSAARALSDLISTTGITASYQANFEISHNEIKNIYSPYEGVHPTGISSRSCNNMVIEKNYIHDMVYTASQGYGAYGISFYAQEGTASDPVVEISNNIIRRISSDGDYYVDVNEGSYFDNVPTGIVIDGSTYITTGINIYYNSIYLSPDSEYGLNYPGQNPNFSVGILIRNGPTGMNVVNNIFYAAVGPRTSYGNTTQSYGIWCKSASSPFGTIDYNVYYGSNHDSHYTGLSGLGDPPSNNYNLAGWQAFTGQEAHSQWGDPLYNTDLLGLSAQGSPAYASGTPLAAVPDDYDGNSRDGTQPTIGAHEYTFIPGFWTGIVSTSWFDANNWDDLAVPDASVDVVIPADPAGGRFPVLPPGVTAVCNNFTLRLGASFTIQSTATLDIQGTAKMKQ